MIENGVIIAKHPSDQGHWYHKDGTPAYTIIGKNGIERPTTLRDAKKRGDLLPSVTEIIKMAAKPGLESWKQDQTILACLTLPRLDDEPETDYIARIKKDAKEQATKAAERGTLIHAYVQEGFAAIPYKKLAEAGRRYYESAKDTLDAECSLIEWIVEKSFATERYGGKADLHSEDYLIDIKTTEKDLSTIKTWDEQSMQLAGYNAGLGNYLRKCGILYIHVLTAESKLIWIEEKELKKGLDCFNALLDFWYAKVGL